jgi:hypothetical protein
MGFSAVELAPFTDPEAFIRKHSGFEKLVVIQNSDAHDLGCIQDASHIIDIAERTPKAVLDALRHRS